MLCKVNAFCGKRRTARGKTFCRHPFFFFRADGETRKSMRRYRIVRCGEYSSTSRRVLEYLPQSTLRRCARPVPAGHPWNGIGRTHRKKLTNKILRPYRRSLAGQTDGQPAYLFIFSPAFRHSVCATMGKPDEMQGKRPFY